MLENGKAGCVSGDVEQQVRKQLHDMSNVLTVLVGRAEILSKSLDLSLKDKKEIEEIVEQGFVCFEILEKARNIFKKKAA